jgi:hypothetical protein
MVVVAATATTTMAELVAGLCATVCSMSCCYLAGPVRGEAAGIASVNGGGGGLGFK